MTTPTYKELLQMPQWRTKRKEILLRDGNKCRSCGTKGNLHIHHRQYHANSKTGLQVLPWKYKNDLLIALCANCHRAGHSLYQVKHFLINL